MHNRKQLFLDFERKLLRNSKTAEDMLDNPEAIKHLCKRSRSLSSAATLQKVVLGPNKPGQNRRKKNREIVALRQVAKQPLNQSRSASQVVKGRSKSIGKQMSLPFINNPHVLKLLSQDPALARYIIKT